MSEAVFYDDYIRINKALQYNSDTNSWSGFIADVYKAKKGIVELGDEFTKFTQKAKDDGYNFEFFYNSHNDEELNQWIDKLNLSDESLKSFLKTWDGTGDIATAYQQHLVASGKATSTFATLTQKAGTVVKSLGASLASMGAMWLIGEGIGLAAQLVDSWIETEKEIEEAREELRQLGEEARNTIDEINSGFESTKSTVNEVADKYARLAQEVGSLGKIGQNQGTLSNDEYTEFLDISNQLSELFPTITKGYDDNGNAILNLSGNVSTITNELYKLVDAEKAVASIEMQEQMDDIFNATSSQNSIYSGDWNKENDKIKALTDSYNRIMNSYTNGVDYSSSLNLIEGGEVFDALTEDLDILGKYYKTVGDEYSQYSSVYDFSTLTDEDIQVLKESYNKLYKEYLSERQHLSDKIIAENKNFGKYIIQSVQGDENFSSLTESQQGVINNILTNLSYDTLLPDYDDWDTFYEDYILDTVIKSIKNINNEQVNSALIDALNGNFTTVSLHEIINQLIGEYGFTEDNPLILYLQTELVESVSKDDIIKNQLGFNQNASNVTDANHNQEVNKFIDSLENEEKTLWLNAEIPESVLNGNIEDWKNHLSELQGIAEENSLLSPFEELLSSSSYKDTRDKLIELSQLGLLDENSISDLEGYNELLEACGGKVDDLIKKVEEYAKTSSTAFGSINDLTTIKGGLNTLESVYADKFDGDNFVSSDLLSGLYEEFGNLDVFNDFIDVMTNMQSTAKETEDAFNNLATAYIDSKYNMANLTEADKDYVIAAYEKMGVTNAETAVDERLKYVEAQRSKVLEQLAESEQSLAIAKLSGIETSDDLANATWEEITALANEIEVAGQDASYLRALALAKQGVNASTINTTTDVAQLVNMAKAAGLSAAYIRLLENAKHIGDATSQANAIATIKDEIMNAFLDFDIGFSPVGYDYTPPSGGGGGSSTPEEAEATVETIDWIEIAIERLEYQINQLDKTVGNVYANWTDRNSALTDEIAKVKDEIALQEQAYYAYLGKANSIGLSEEYKQKVQNGTIQIEDIEDEVLRQQIADYQTWLEKAMECSNAIQDLQINLGELAEQKFDNIQAEFDGLIGVIESLASIIDEQISGVEERGYFVSEDYYKQLIKYEEDTLSKNKALLEQLKTSLNEAVSSGVITEGSEAYNDMYQEILGVQQAIEESTNSIVEFNNAIRDIKWEIFDFLQERIQEITTETEFLIDLIDNSSLFNDNGSFNSDGKSVIALHGINYNTYMEQAKQYADELAKIESELAKDPANQNLINRRKELLELQQESITSAEAEKDAIKSLVEEGINLHLSKLTELIDKYKESLNATKDLYEYNRSIGKQTNEISRLEKMIMAYSGDDSEESRKLVQEYQVQLKDAEESLSKTQWDRYISETSTLLDDLYSDYEEVLNARLDDISLLVSDMIDMVNSSSTEIENAINNASSEVGYSITQGLSNIISGNNTMLSAFNGDFNTYSTNVQTILGKIASHVENIANDPTGTSNNNNSNGANNSSNTQSNTANKINSNIKPGSSIGVNVGDSVIGGGLAFYDDTGKFAYVELENGYKGWVETSQIFGKYNGGDAIIAHSGGKTYSGNIGFYDSTGKYAYVELANGYKGWIDSNMLSKGFNPADKIKVNTGNEDVNGNLGFYNENGEYAYVELENGYKGWVLTSQLKEYAKGSKRINKSQLAWTQEDGTEIIYRASDGAMLTPLSYGDKVFTHEMSENLWKIAQGNLPNFINSFKAPTAIPKLNTTSVNNQNTIAITLPNVSNYNEFKNALQKDSKFVGFMQEVTLGQAIGNNKLNRNKY